MGNGGTAFGFHFPNFPDIDDVDELGMYGLNNDSRRSSRGGESIISEKVGAKVPPSGVDIKVIPPSNSESGATSPQIDSFSHTVPSPTAPSPSICLNPNPGTANSSARNSIHIPNNMNEETSEADLHKIITLMAEKQKEEEQVEIKCFSKTNTV